MRAIAFGLRMRELALGMPRLRIGRKLLAAFAVLILASAVVAGATILMSMNATGPKPQANPFTNVCASALTTTDAIIAGGVGWADFTCGGASTFTSAGSGAKATVTTNTSTNEPWTGITVVQYSDVPDLTKTSCATAFAADANAVKLGDVPSGPDPATVNAGTYSYCVDYSASPSIGPWLASISVIWTK